MSLTNGGSKDMDQQFLTVSQATRLLDLSSDSVRRFEWDGILPAIRVGKGHRLFAHSDVERLRVQCENRSNQQPVAS